MWKKSHQCDSLIVLIWSANEIQISHFPQIILDVGIVKSEIFYDVNILESLNGLETPICYISLKLSLKQDYQNRMIQLPAPEPVRKELAGQILLI